MSMIEKVARAICRSVLVEMAEAEGGKKYQEEDLVSRVDGIWENYIGDAKAAIEAMMEPTEEMTDVGENAAKIEYAGPDYAADAIYKSMLRQALKDT